MSDADRTHPIGMWNNRKLVAFRDRAGCPSKGWWSQTGSNRRPHACKARALPTELWPLTFKRPAQLGAVIDQSSARPRVTQWKSVVGPGGLEPPTSRLSGVCSNQLSYRPLKRSAQTPVPKGTRRLNARSHRLPERQRCQRKEKRRRRRPAPDYICL